MASIIETESSIQTAPSLNQDVDLETILNAWQTATDRLQKTHQLLRKEVRRLTDELEIKNRELARKNRLADLGQMATHVAHEVRNSLVPMTLYLSLLRRRVGENPQTLDAMDKIDSGFLALESTVNDLLHFTSDREPHLGDVLLEELVHEIIDTLAPQFNAQDIAIDMDIAPDIVVSADRNMLHRCVLNLVLNAFDVMPGGGRLTLTAVPTSFGVEFEISDNGPGIPETVISHLFEPFYTTKSGGTGLGLSIVERIADAHGGQVTACNCPEGGAAFTLILPAHIPAHIMESAA